MGFYYVNEIEFFNMLNFSVYLVTLNITLWNPLFELDEFLVWSTIN